MSTFENATGGDFGSSHFRLHRAEWGDRQTGHSFDESVGLPQLYPPAYPEVQYHEQRAIPPIRSMDSVGPGYYPPFQTASYSPSPHSPTDEAHPTSRPVHVVAPTPVNLVIQTNFTHVEHNYYYASQGSDTSSGYGSTPPPSTASSTRSSFSYCSSDSPATPFDQSQELTVTRSSQGHPPTHGLYLLPSLRHQYGAVDGHCYQPSPPAEDEAPSSHSSPSGQVHPHGTYYQCGNEQHPGDYESTDHDRGYESESESDGRWITRSAPGYVFYTTPNQAAGMWRHCHPS